MELCLLCKHPKDDHTNAPELYCDYFMAPGDMPNRYTPQWHEANPYKNYDPESARHWEKVRYLALSELEAADAGG